MEEEKKKENLEIRGLQDETTGMREMEINMEWIDREECRGKIKL